MVSLSPSGKYVADFAFFDKVAKTKTSPFFKQALSTIPVSQGSHYQAKEGNGVDTEKMRLEESYRGEDRGKERRIRDSSPLCVRISNVWGKQLVVADVKLRSDTDKKKTTQADSVKNICPPICTPKTTQMYCV